ncbi:MAG: hypothetical protein HYX63_01570 [Gammaproteobacteria bacterium]|nr:hypothetical protein [Gammaproteobacteria bacterium]
MSFQITEAFVNQYTANFYELGQQITARLEPYCTMYDGINGQSKSVERVGKAEAYDIVSRHADTKYVEVSHSRRWIDLQDKGWAELVDELDEVRLLADPKSKYPKLGVQALNRAKDDIMIAAARGLARTNSGTTPLPTAQKIVEGGTASLTLAKLLTAKEILDSAEVANAADESGMEPTGQAMISDRVCVVSAKQLTALYGTTEIKSIDYNSVKALAQGQVDTFLGFKFIRSERLFKTGTMRSVMVWARPCMGLGIGKDVSTSIDRLPGKNNSVQVYARMSIGAVRIEDEGVVEIQCFE